MIDSLWVRSIVILGLLLSVGIMGVHYSKTANHVNYPSIDELQTNYDQFLGQETYYWMSVVEVRDDALIATPGEQGPRFTIRIQNPDAKVGDAIQVYGIIRPDYTIGAEKVIISEQERLITMFAISGIAAILTLVMFFRSWTIDWRAGMFKLRGEEDA